MSPLDLFSRVLVPLGATVAVGAIILAVVNYTFDPHGWR